ncbi:MAG: AAA family ATPase, partial [Proteobacteria bacterium]|nr:AAA family ATPase [Pseudomonadota bacterium]
MRPVHLTKILRCEISSLDEGGHTPVMLWGAPGVGKSQIVAQVAAEENLPLIDIRLSQLEPTDLRGIPFRVDDCVEWAIPSMLPHSEKHGLRGILFLD